MLNTQVFFLRKEREPTSKEFDDEEWIQWLQGIPESEVDGVGPEM